MIKNHPESKRAFIILCLIGTFAILSSTMSKNPVLNPFAANLGTPDAFMGFIAAASTIPGILVSFLATIMDIGQMLGPIITGFIIASFGYSGSFLALGVVLLGFCIFFTIFQRLYL